MQSLNLVVDTTISVAIANPLIATVIVLPIWLDLVFELLSYKKSLSFVCVKAEYFCFVQPCRNTCTNSSSLYPKL